MKQSQKCIEKGNQNDQENLPLNKVLKPRHAGKKIPQRGSSDSKQKDSSLLKKNKPISKEKKDTPNKVSHVSSTDIARELVFNETLEPHQINDLIIKLKNIKSLKYDKLSEKIRQTLIETIFKNNYHKFVNIISAYNPLTGSPFLIQSIFHGFQLAWKKEKFNSINYFTDFFKLYCLQIPNTLNKTFAKWIKDRAEQQTDKQIYKSLRKKVQQHVNDVIKKNHSNRQRSSTQTEKIIALIVYFDLLNQINMDQLVKIVPLQKINEYIDNDLIVQLNLDDNNKNQKMKQNKQKLNQKDKPQNIVAPPLVHASILELLKQNNLREIQKLIKAHKIPYTNYPEFVQKLQIKYLEYLERSNPIYVVDQVIHGKINLIENLVELYLKRKKYQLAEHFIHKYKLRGIQSSDKLKIFKSPLKEQDSFGPTESHVLNQRPQDYFLRLNDFNISKNQIIWVDTQTIQKKHTTQHLKKLIYAKQIGLDSESFSGIHVFEKSKLQLIQIYQPESDVVLLFDVKDFKADKKKRARNIKNQENKINTQKTSIQQFNQINDKLRGKSIEQPIDLEQNNQIQEQKNQNQNLNNQNFQQSSKQKQQNQNKTWDTFSKIIKNVLKRSIVYGHVLHSDLGDIIQQLNLDMKPCQITIRDSQIEFKKYFPEQTKSKLSFLAQKCYGKQISKFQQCGAWDKRPLRDAQKHYAALDAVLPYKLIKWMWQKGVQKKQ